MDDWMDEIVACALDPERPVFVQSPHLTTVIVDPASKTGRRGKVIHHIQLADERVLPAPEPRPFVGGFYRMPPIASNLEAMEACRERLGRRARVKAVCLTCQEVLESSHADDGVAIPIEQQFGAANDHVRYTINHAVIVLAGEEETPVWMSTYDPIKTQAHVGAGRA